MLLVILVSSLVNCKIFRVYKGFLGILYLVGRAVGKSSYIWIAV